MASAHRCSKGHTWLPAADGAAETCPVCGDTPTPRLPQDGSEVTLAYVGPIPAHEPSFSSLTGMPGSSASQVEFGALPPSDGRPTTEFIAPLVPGYEILHEIGRGGMGVVYKARQLSLNRTVALKMILSGAHAGPAERERFRREAKSAAALQHSNIVQIFEVGEANGHPYLVLEHVEGGSLAQQIGNGTPWSASAAAALVEMLAHAMQYAHEQGIVHRDLKPGNVLLTGGRKTGDSSTTSHPSLAHAPKVTDFGLAKQIDEAVGSDGATRTGAVMGTPSYIAPEQASGKVHDIGPPADVYALGAILYELLTGRPPFRGASALDTVLQVLHDDPVSPKRLQSNVPRDLETICLKCLVKSPAKRYPSALALAEDLRRFLNGEPIRARPLSAWGRGVKWAKRHPALTVLGCATVLATVGLVSVLSVAYARVKDAVEQKEAEATAAQIARDRAEAEKVRAERLADENLKAKIKADEQAATLQVRSELNRRAAFALRLSQVAALCERDPRRASRMLDDESLCPPDLRDFTWAYLRRLCHREERVYADHSPRDASVPLSAVAHSNRGGFSVTGGQDGSVRVWDPRTGRTWAVLYGTTGAVNGLDVSEDGGVIAAAGADGAVRIWELPIDVLETARRTMTALSFLQPIVPAAIIRPRFTLDRAHAGGALCVAFAHDGKTFASGGADGKVRLWELPPRHPPALDAAVAGGAAAQRVTKVIREVLRVPIDAHPKSRVLCLAFSTDGTLASGGSDKAVRVWSADGARTIRTLPNHADAVLAVAFAPDGETLYTANNADPPTIRVISTTSWEDLRRLSGHSAAIHAMAVSHDGQLLASAGFDGTVRLWDADDGRERGLLYGHQKRVSGLAFGTDRRTLISAGMDGVARVWRTTPRANDAANVTDPQWDMARQFRYRPPAAGRDRALASAAVGANGNTLIFGEVRGLSAWLGEAARGRPTGVSVPGVLPLWRLPVDAPPAEVKAVAVLRDGRGVVAALPNELMYWRVNPTGNRPMTPGALMPAIMSKTVRMPTPKPVKAMATDASGTLLATIDGGGVRVWNMRSLLFPPEAPVPPQLVLAVPDAFAVAFDPTGERLAVAVTDGIRIVTRTGQLLGVVPNAHDGKIESIAFDAAGTTLATGDSEGRVRVWNVSVDGTVTPRTTMTGHTLGVESLAFSPDGRTLASGSDDRTVILWDPVTGQERAVLTEHVDKVIRVQFTPDGASLYTVSRDGVVRRWRAEPPRPTPTPGSNQLQPLHGE